MNLRTRYSWLVFVLPLTLASVAWANFVNGASTGLTNPTQTITFDEHLLASAAPLTAQYADLGVTFSQMTYSPDSSGSPHIDAYNIGNFQPYHSAMNPFSIHFNQLVSSALFNEVTQPDSTVTFQAYRAGVAVAGQNGTASTDNTNTSNFYGFTDVAGGFDEIRMSVANNSDRATLIDNLQFIAVPEPASFALFGMAIIPSLSRRRRAKAL